MKYLVLCFNFLVVINTVYSALTVDAPTSITFDKTTTNTIKLQCNVSQTADLSKVQVEWKKEDKLLKDVTSLTGRFNEKRAANSPLFTLEITKASEADQGNYTCQVRDENAQQEKSIEVIGAIFLKVPENVNVVEGEKLRIHCQVAGTPVPPLVWKFTPDGLDNTTELPNEGRYSMEEDEHKNPNSILIVQNITMDDRGHFECSSGLNPGLKAATMVRVKGKYAALWPFLGIVAEVVILCAIIFIYEKKHNKAELDESDTDQSPDQKNTPDHGKDGLRHRQ